MSFGIGAYAIVSLSADSFNEWRNGTALFFASIAAGLQYRALDKIQGEIKFSPSFLEVTASVTNRTIQVHRLKEIEASDPEPSGALREWAMRNLGIISPVLTTLYESSVGEALVRNINRKLNENLDMTTDTQPDVVFLPAISESIEAGMDDILESLAAAALTRAGSFQEVPGIYYVPAIQIGSNAYAFVAFSLNAVAMFMMVCLTIHNIMFRESPAFDISDIATLMYVVKNGESLNRDSDVGIKEWRGCSDDAMIGSSTAEIDISLKQVGPPSIWIHQTLLQIEHI